MTVLNFVDIEFPTFKDIPKFENLNNVSINVYSIEDKQFLPLRLTDDKRDKHVNLYLQDSRNDNIRHFAWIKNLSLFVRSLLGTRTKNIFAIVSIIRKVDKKTIFENNKKK